MSCGCDSGSSYDGGYGNGYNGLCNADTPYPSVSSESVPSLINNLTYALYGQIQKNVTNGQVTWTIPCDPNSTATINGIPRVAGEGLLCYIIRALNLTTPSGFVTVDGVQTLTNKTLVSPTITGSGAIAGIFTGNLTGNAGTATTLATSRTIALSGDVTGTATSFNGSANISIPVTINAGSVTPSDLSTGAPTWDTSGNSNILGTITSAQEVITGNSTTGTALQIVNTGTGGRNWTINSNGSGNTGGAGSIILYDATAPAVRVIVDTSGNVGIGTSSPARKLHLANASSVEQIWEQTDALTDYRKYNAVVSMGSVAVGATYLFRILNDAGSAATKNIYAITPDGKIDTQGNPITNCKTTAKAWVNFNGTTATPSTIRSSFNVSSITKNGTGSYTVNYATPLADANCSVAGSFDDLGSTGAYSFCCMGTGTNSTTVVMARPGVGYYDHSRISVQVFGN
jgi:hypothetical protein